MKILLISPPSFGSQLRWDDSGFYPPLGLAYLASLLEDKHNVKIIDGPADNLSENQLKELIKSEKPDLIGISSIIELHKQFMKTIDLCREYNKNIKIIVGGPYSSSLRKKVMSMNKNIDFVVKGEGEYTLLELVNAIDNHEDFDNVKGIIFRKENQIIETPDRELIHNLDELPLPARHLLDIKSNKYRNSFRYKQLPITTVITSRGCPFSCIFCERPQGFKYRAYSAEYVLNELKYLKDKYGIREIHFVDDNFTLDPNRIRKLCKLLIDNKLNLTWSCNARIDVFYKNKDLIPLIKKAGGWYMSLGIESGNQDILDFIRKRITLTQIREVVKQMNKHKMFIKGFFMLGIPTETKENIRQTIDFAKSLKLDAVQFNLVTPFSSPEFYDICSKYGKIELTNYEDISGHGRGDPVYIPNGMSKEYLKEIQKKAYKEVYFRFSYILRQILKIRSFKEFRKYIRKSRIYLK